MLTKMSARRRRDRKITKIYRKLAIHKNPRLEHRLRCLEQAEANDIWKAAQPPIDMAKFEKDLAHAKELLAKYGQKS
jgi:hypothetical protein